VTLSQYVLYRIGQHYCYLKSKLFELYRFPMGGSRAIEQRRSGLEKQLDALNQEMRGEMVTCWQDVAKLRAELRQWWKQYEEARQRTAIVLGGRRSNQPRTLDSIQRAGWKAHATGHARAKSI